MNTKILHRQARWLALRTRAYDASPPTKRAKRFWASMAGFTAAETALLALVLCGICIMVGNIIFPAAKTAAKRLNTELAGHVVK